MERILPILPDPAAGDPSLSSRNGYVPIRLDSVQNDTEIDFDLYLDNPQNGSKILYRNRNLVFKYEHRQRLLENNLKILYVSRADIYRYYAYVESHLGSLLPNPNVAPREKAFLLYETCVHRVRQILEEPERPENILHSLSLADHTLNFLINEEKALDSFLETMSFDYYTYTHSMNVCVFSVLLAQRLGIRDQEVLRTLSIGSLLHDIGKSKIQPEVLFKKGPLGDREWKIIRQHPAIGYDLLKATGLIQETSLLPVRHHHERADGSGYPDGLSAGSIDLLASIVRVVDIFDALTTDRCYKRAEPAFEALNITKEEMRSPRDKDIFHELILLLGPKPGEAKLQRR